MYDLNQMAVDVSKYEGMKKQVNIAQIKEVMRCICQLLLDKPIDTANALLRGALALKDAKPKA